MRVAVSVTFTALTTVVATALAFGSAPQGIPLSSPVPAVQIVVPAAAAAATCTVQKDGRTLWQETGQRLTLPCRSASTEVLSCDGSGLEPLDIRVADACGVGQVSLRPGSPVPVDTAEVADITVDWLELASTGSFSVAATRRVHEAPFVIVVAADSKRFVRFSRPGAAPVTVAASELLKSQKWRLPEPQRGGELLVAIAPADVAPMAVTIVGPGGTRQGPATDGTFSVRGAMPGVFAVTPLYEGGLQGPATRTRVQPGASTLVYVPREDVGRTVVTASGQYCASATDVRIVRIEDDANFKDVWRTKHRSQDPCRWVIAGLSPGSYQAYVSGPHGASGIAEFGIVTQRTVSARTTPPAVVLTGKITRKGIPLRDVRIVGVRPNAQPPWSTTSGVDGAFRLYLDKPGTYRFEMKDSSGVTLAMPRTIAVTNGVNRADWSLTSGLVAVQLHGIRGRAPTRVILRGQNAVFQVVVLGGGSAAKRGGLPLGEYKVSAVNEGDQWTVSNETVTVNLDTTHPDATVDLYFVANTSTLILRDQMGRPVSGARIEARGIDTSFGGREPSSVVSTAPGVFSLAHLPPGTELQIRGPKGLAPVCRLVPLDRDMEVILHRGRSVEIEIDGPKVSELSPLLGSLSGAALGDCAVPLSQFESARVPSTPRGNSRFAIADFPDDRSALVWHLNWGPKAGQRRLDSSQGHILLSFNRR